MYTYGEGLIRKDSEVPLFDGQGTERTVTNGSQTVVGTINLDGFGNQVGSTGSSSSPYMYAATSGYRNDGDAGLTHVGARYYDSQAGRFITRDTNLNQKPYLYCEHDPVNGLDPSGHAMIPPGSGGDYGKLPKPGIIDRIKEWIRDRTWGGRYRMRPDEEKAEPVPPDHETPPMSIPPGDAIVIGIVGIGLVAAVILAPEITIPLLAVAL